MPERLSETDLDGFERQLDESGAATIADALAASERQRKDLEAQAAVLAEAVQALVNQMDQVHDDERYKSVWTLHQVHGGKYDGPQYGEQLKALKALLANLPQAVQQHMERDRAAERMVKLFAEMATGDYVPTAQRARQEVDAYRAVGGEG